MIPLKIVYSAVKGQFAKKIQELANPIAVAATAAVGNASTYVKTNGRAAIKQGGFGIRWQNALRTKVYPSRGASIDAAMFAYHRIPYASIFQNGGAISGSPLLWLPLPGVPAKFGGKRLTPKIFIQTIGPLHSVNIPGKPPMLAAYMSGTADTSKITVRKIRAGFDRLQKRGPNSVVSVPIFYGISQVKMTQKFNLKSIYKRARDNLATYYVQNIRAGKK